MSGAIVRGRLLPAALLMCGLLITAWQTAAGQVIPHHQDRPPGPPLSPEQAVAKMDVPPGFTVELVASEPQIVNPVAMTFDELGRIWITESLEYPRLSAGPGRDRIKVLEDTDADGRVDKVTVFADGLNIPSGIAVGHGGVWVANSPDILFLQDTDGDGRADRREVVVTGFGRRDTHELPNSLTWGPDGYLYGLNGVFNPSVIEQNGRRFEFTCALFRIDPRTRRFELFAEGTSNPWGVAWDPVGNAFLSACVIDHLWHLTETGYYHRQGGPYPPHTWKLESIVNHQHQKAAYCGIHYFDSDAYPKQYRDRLYMGNIHGNCINVDVLEDSGASYKASPAPDFLTANDAWFMPVAQKTGPDGCLYILDWYDRYHCYQDARRDPEGIDRLKGRLYRIRYGDNPRAGRFNLTAESDEQLVERLHSPNVFVRDVAQRLLIERNHDSIRAALRRLVMDERAAFKPRMHALWSLVGTGRLDPGFHAELLDHKNHEIRAWGVRAAGNFREIQHDVRELVERAARDEHPRVVVQAAIAARKVQGVKAMDMLVDCLISSRGDRIIPHIVWQNLHPLLENQHQEFLLAVQNREALSAPDVAALLPRVVDRVLASEQQSLDFIVDLIALLTTRDVASADAARQCLTQLRQRILTRELTGDRLNLLRDRLSRLVSKSLTRTDHPLRDELALLATAWGDRTAAELTAARVADNRSDTNARLAGLESLVAARSSRAIELSDVILKHPQRSPPSFRGDVLTLLGRLNDDGVARIVMSNYGQLEPDLQPRAIELLTGRNHWSHMLLQTIAEGSIPREALNINQVRKLLATRDQELINSVQKHWGVVRSERNPNREQIIDVMRVRLRNEPGDPVQGRLVFRKVCGQCHAIYGEGQQVGPDITRNGRSSYDQLLSNVFDPNLVIGAAYQAMTVVTTEGRVITGLVVENTPQRIVLKVQGGKLETIARSDVDESQISPLSLMPEGLEKQLRPQELYDLFAFLTLDRAPEDAEARTLPGFRGVQEHRARRPDEYVDVLRQVMPGFQTELSGEGGVTLLSQHMGRSVVVRTHPVSEQRACVLQRQVQVPAEGTSRLVIEVSHDPRGDWLLGVTIRGGDRSLQQDYPISRETTQEGWRKIEIDLNEFRGGQADIRLMNQASGWSWEFGYWARVDIVTDLPITETRE